MTASVAIRTELRPGDLGRLIALHGTAYIEDAVHFGLPFEAFVARTVAEFVLDNNAQGRIWLAERGSELVACAAMVEREKEGRPFGQLRWVLADPSVRGTGLGKKLVIAAVEHARAQGWTGVYLETTEGLDASMGIYRQLGFAEISRETERLWRGETAVITMALDF